MVTAASTKKKQQQLKALVKLVFSLSILCVNLLYRNRCLSWNNEEISEHGIEAWKIVLNTYVLRYAKHGIVGMSEWVSQIGKNPQMKAVLIFLHVPVFSSVGWLSYKTAQ